MMKFPRNFVYASAALALAASGTSAHALKIILTDTGGVAAGTAAYDGFNAAARYWESVLLDDVTVRINVAFTTANFAPTTLGDASSSSSQKTQAAWRAALIADATTTLDSIATANLATFSNPNVLLNTTVQKAIGLYTGSATASDATIRFNAARPFDFDTTNGFQGVASDFVSVAVHEIGHALGFTSAVGTNTTLNSRPANTDMFRYQNGAWDIRFGGDPYFSIDGGATEVFGRSDFSPGSDGFQTSHWEESARIHNGVDCTIVVEAQIGILDPTGGLCQEGIVTAQDLALFDAIGWNLNMDILSNPNYAYRTSQIITDYYATAPEPATWGMMLIGFGMIGAAARSRYRIKLSAV